MQIENTESSSGHSYAYILLSRELVPGPAIIIIRLLGRCAAVPAHEAYIAHTAHPVLCTHFGFKKRNSGCILPLSYAFFALSKGVMH